MEDRNITLKTKPGAPLHVSIAHHQPQDERQLSDTLVVFLNGLVLPRAGWFETVEHLSKLRSDSNQPTPALLCYDRYGQGKSDSDPFDIQDSPYGHDARAAIADLHQLLIQVSQDELHRQVEDLRIILVCNSIGCPLARLYAAEHPGRVGAYLFLDSMMANTDFVSVFPDPAEPDFDESQLAEGVTAEGLRHARDKFREFFHPTVPNSERLDRRNLRELLPHASEPALPNAPGGDPPLLTVVGHDWDEFADQCEKGPLAVPKAIINTYMNPAWGTYNEGLTRLVQVTSDVKIAKGCGHFIQKDDPAFVAGKIDGILNELRNRGQ
ncbi:Alpha/Beta hydrolase protein [Chaetomium fimeti]|uniref:Alpha/Beta hydrolase protein n=1 Tax=Chaetomium fimeti TaxID=1854472 RepID=A0AAE0LT52_9PEZI|nr:Alpha/Beta hydrolase protein [Chaetomium fimeti]